MREPKVDWIREPVPINGNFLPKPASLNWICQATDTAIRNHDHSEIPEVRELTWLNVSQKRYYLMNGMIHITVRNRRPVFVVCIAVIVLLILICVLFTVLLDTLPTGLYFITGTFLIIPIALGAAWSIYFEATVDGSEITVRGYPGGAFSFDLSDIKQVNCWKNAISPPDFDKPMNTASGRLVEMRITTFSRKYLILKKPMIGFEEMSEYILENVDSSIVRYKRPRGLPK